MVAIGGVVCQVSASTATSLECALGESPGGAQPVVATINGKGSTTAFESLTVPVTVTNISPDNGSEQGGTLVTLTGTGNRLILSRSCLIWHTSDLLMFVILLFLIYYFIALSSSNTVVNFGTVPCEIISVEYTKIICRTQAQAVGNTAISVSVGTETAVVDGSVTFTHEAASVTVTGISMTKLSPLGSISVDITLHNSF